MAQVEVGTTFNSPLMDGNPEWTVTEVSGKYCTAQTGDDWLDAPNHEAAFLVSEVQRSLAWKESLDRMSRKNDDFWATAVPGSTLHYHNGFGEYVRGVVTPDHKLQPVALVGNWSGRNPDYYVEMIEQGEGAWQPHESNVFEAPGFSPPRHKDAPADPRPLAPLEYVSTGRQYPQFTMVQA